MSDKHVTILAIETSCDETGVAVLRQYGQTIEVLGEGLSSQTDTHKLTGGVIPEAAAREHISIIKPMIASVLRQDNVSDQELDGIAITVGPGLIPALSVGVTAAKALSYAWNKPLIPVNHLEGHIYSALLHDDITGHRRVSTDISDSFPALALIVSGGHTLLINVKDHLNYEVLGTTRDDAAGEAFDKVARLLGLPYPGGPQLSRLAETGNGQAFKLPRPMISSKDLDFSFSGLKTAVLYTIRDLPSSSFNKQKADLAASFEQAVVDSLVFKTKQAAIEHRPNTILLAGGVAANTKLRDQMRRTANELNINLKIAPLDLCGDNAVMIGQAGLFAFQGGRKASWSTVDAIARPALKSFTAQNYETRF